MERTKQTGLNELVEKRIAQKIAKGAVNVQEATTRMIAEGKMSRDFIFEVGAERKGTKSSILFKPDTNSVGATFRFPKSYDGPAREEDFRINLHAVRQVSTKLGIPTTYLTGLLFGSEWERNLGYSILNTHNGWYDRSNVLVRAVGNEVRGVLSDQYRRLDSEMIFGAHIEEIFNNGAVLCDGYMDDTRVMLESILPKPIEIKTELNGIVMVAFGTRIDTSDYGDRALAMWSFVMQGVCLNGMVRETRLREVHLGGKLPQTLGLSEKTYRLDSEATASAVTDLTKALFSSETVKTRMLEIKAASSDPAEPENVLRNLMVTGKLLKGETEEIGKLLMRNSPKDGLFGESTLWKISQGITAYANGEDLSPRRRMDLQEAAGKLIASVSKN